MDERIVYPAPSESLTHKIMWYITGATTFWGRFHDQDSSKVWRWTQAVWLRSLCIKHLTTRTVLAATARQNKNRKHSTCFRRTAWTCPTLPGSDSVASVQEPLPTALPSVTTWEEPSWTPGLWDGTLATNGGPVSQQGQSILIAQKEGSHIGWQGSYAGFQQITPPERTKPRNKIQDAQQAPKHQGRHGDDRVRERAGHRQPWNLIPVLPISCCATLGKLLNLSDHLLSFNRDKIFIFQYCYEE